MSLHPQSLPAIPEKPLVSPEASFQRGIGTCGYVMNSVHSIMTSNSLHSTPVEKTLHALARQIFFGRLGELRDRALEDQIHRASCLHLLMAAITAWNTVYLTEAFAHLRKQGENISESTIAHIAPLGWEHVNLIGHYQFSPQKDRSLDNLRPLRVHVSSEEPTAAD